ncbi:MAG: ABC transporter substrate-binding protein [Chloroflexi bacterium]|nr:ABC transporter substrate-binding protein [Chloroflexota bacterium]
MKQLLSLVSLVVILSLILIPIGCDKQVDTSFAGTIKIGCLVTITGSQAGLFEDAYIALKDLCDSINNGTHHSLAGKGLEIDGKRYKLEVVKEDSTGEAIQASTAKLIAVDQVVALIGSASAQGVRNIQSITEGQGVVFISLAGATTSSTMYFGKNPDGTDKPVQFFFRCTSLPYKSVPATYELLFKGDGTYGGQLKNNKKLYTVLVNDAGGQEYQPLMESWANANGVQYMGNSYYTTGTGSFSSIADSIVKSGANVVDAAGIREGDVGNLLKDLKAKGYTGITMQTIAQGIWAKLVEAVGGPSYSNMLTGYTMRYVPPSLEVADQKMIDYMAQSGYTAPDWLTELYATASKKANIAQPAEYIKYYSVSEALVTAIKEAKATTLSKANSVKISTALGETTVYDLFSTLKWRGLKDFGRKCGLDYNNHFGRFKSDGTMEWLFPLIYKWSD